MLTENVRKDKQAVRPSKTVETMFRITSSNSQKLSEQADAKSNLLITVNSITASVLVTYIANRIGHDANMVVPLMLLLIVNMLTIAFAILATRPSIPKGSFTPRELAERKTNLLFFGNFYRMHFDDYCAGMMRVISNEDVLYKSLLQDLYCQGCVLGRKYRMLKISYTIFLWGMIAAITAFFVAFNTVTMF